MFELALASGDSREFIRAIVKRMLVAAEPENIPLSEIWSNLSRVEAIVGGDEVRAVLARLSSRTIAGRLSGDGWKEIDPAFLSAVADKQLGFAGDVKTAISTGLTAMPAEEWRSALASEGNEMALLFASMEMGFAPTLELSFHDALQSDTEARLEGGGALPTKYSAKWPTLPSVLQVARRDAFYKWLRDQLINRFSNPKSVRDALMLFGSEFLESADFVARSDDTLRAILEPMVAEATIECLQTILQYSTSFLPVVDAASEGQRSLLEARFAAVYGAGDDELKTEVFAAANALGFHVSPETAKEEDLQESHKDD